MNTDNAQEIQAFFTLWQDTLAIYGAAANDRTLDIISHVLAPYSLQDIADALAQHVKKSVYAPKPADIVAIIEGKTKIDPAIGAERAYTEVMAGVRSIRNVMIFADPRTAYATRVTWGGIGAASLSESKWRDVNRRRFIDTWAAATPEAYEGISQIEVIDGEKWRPTVGFIGDRDACLAITHTQEFKALGDVRLPDPPRGLAYQGRATLPPPRPQIAQKTYPPEEIKKLFIDLKQFLGGQS